MKRLALLALLVACGPRTPRSGDDGVPWSRSGIDWTKPPTVASALPWTPPVLREAVLANGIRIVVAENHRLPLVSLGVIHTAAGSREDGDKHGLASITLELLDDNIETRSDDRGIRIETAIATDHAAQHLSFHVRELAVAFERLAATLRTPDLDDVYDLTKKRGEQLEMRKFENRRTAAQLFDRVVFGEHPYAYPAEGTYGLELDEKAVQAFWKRAYRPDAMTIVVAGDTTIDAVRAQVERVFGSWKAPATAIPLPPALPAYKARIAVADRGGSDEVNVIIGGRAPGVGQGEQLAAAVANLIVGGGEDGRFARALQGNGLGASASFWRGTAGGSWGVSATFGVGTAAKGIRALLGVVESVRTSEPTAAELATARRALVTGTRNGFETTSTTARALERIVVQRLPLDRFATLDARLAALTPHDLRDVLPLRDLSIVVVGDWEKLEDELSNLGLPVQQYEP